MVRTCCVSGCKKKFGTASVTFHSFPKDAKRRLLWSTTVSQYNKENWKLTNHKAVCSAHFQESCFDRTGQTTRLLSDASPTIFHVQGQEIIQVKHHAVPLPLQNAVSLCSTPKSTHATCSQEIQSQLKRALSESIDDTPVESVKHLAVENDSFTAVTPKSNRILSRDDIIPRVINTPVRRSSFNVNTNDKSEHSDTDSHELQTTDMSSAACTSASANVTSSSDAVEDDTPRKVILKKKLERMTKRCSSQQKKVRVLQQTVRHKKSKITSLCAVIDDLESRKVLSEDGLYIVKKSLPEETKALLERIGKNCKRGKFAPELRSFAMTLHFYSPAAYEYVREKFNLCLPNARTIRSWCSSVNGEPGFNEEALKSLKLIAEKSLGWVADVALIVDEMAIRQHVEFDGKKIVGYIDMGVEINDDSLPEATQACVFMVVGLKTRFKIPCGYFLINSLTGSERAELAKQCICKLYDVGVRVQSLTFDGCGGNIKMLSSLNCVFDVDNIVNSFQHPCCELKIFVFLDACHMLKLIRNCLADKKIIIDESGSSILWLYVHNLHLLQTKHGLKLGNKLSKTHIEWFKKKMNVRLAAQTLSASVADALEFCDSKLKLKQFEGVDATVTFIRIFDQLFDILNSRNTFAPGYKAPLSKYNIIKVTEFCEKAVTYIKSLKDDLGKPMTKGLRKTGFIGFLFCIKSVLGLYDQLIETNRQKYLLTYKMSQDSVELFFGCIRRHCGCNNNPTPRQFKASFKKLLISNEIKMGSRGNCLALEEIDVLYVSSLQPKKSSSDTFSINDINISDIVDDNGQPLNHDYCISKFSSELMSTYSGHVVPYISGYVVKGVEKHLQCQVCIDALKGDTGFALIAQKNRGGLIKPSRDVVNICMQAEKCFTYYCRKFDNVCSVAKQLKCVVLDVMKNVYSSVFKCLTNHVKEFDPLDNHIYFLAKSVCEFYLKIRMYHAARMEQEKLMKSSDRNVLSRLIINKHQ